MGCLLPASIADLRVGTWNQAFVVISGTGWTQLLRSDKKLTDAHGYSTTAGEPHRIPPK
jgi:hypothetical protein